jgi:hypothetical protein
MKYGKLKASRRRGINMENSEKISEKAAAALREGLQRNTGEFVELEKKEALSIDIIEEMWGKAKAETNQVLDEYCNGMINDIREKELVRKKKLN